MGILKLFVILYFQQSYYGFDPSRTNVIPLCGLTYSVSVGIENRNRACTCFAFWIFRFQTLWNSFYCIFCRIFKYETGSVLAKAFSSESETKKKIFTMLKSQERGYG